MLGIEPRSVQCKAKTSLLCYYLSPFFYLSLLHILTGVTQRSVGCGESCPDITPSAPCPSGAAWRVQSSQPGLQQLCWAQQFVSPHYSFVHSGHMLRTLWGEIVPSGVNSAVAVAGRGCAEVQVMCVF